MLNETVLYVTSSAKRCLMEEQSVFFLISGFHMFVVVFLANAAYRVTKMLATNIKGPDHMHGV